MRTGADRLWVQVVIEGGGAPPCRRPRPRVATWAPLAWLGRAQQPLVGPSDHSKQLYPCADGRTSLSRADVFLWKLRLDRGGGRRSRVGREDAQQDLATDRHRRRGGWRRVRDHR